MDIFAPVVLQGSVDAQQKDSGFNLWGHLIQIWL